MKTLIFSDTHFGRKFDKKLFAKLKELIESVDKVIINGDFWDYDLVSWDSFLNSKWSQLFPLLKSKKTVYTFGNHDPERLMDERMNLFSDIQTVSFELKTKSQDFIIQHGNLITPALDETHPFVLRHKKWVKQSYRIYDFLIHKIGLKFLSLGEFKNMKMKKWAAENLKKGQILVCGHSHFMENDMNNRFINTGLIRFGFMQYMIVEGDSFKLVNERY